MNLAQPIEQLSNCQNRRWIIWGHLKWYKQRMNGVLALKGNQKKFRTEVFVAHWQFFEQRIVQVEQQIEQHWKAGRATSVKRFQFNLLVK